MKKIFYGKTGYGKSFTFIAPIINELDNVLLITPNIGVTDELKYMGLANNLLKEVSLNDVLSINLGKYGVHLRDEESIIDLLDKLEFSKFCYNRSNTVIFINTIMFINNIKLVNRINNWSCSVIFEHTCESRKSANIELSFDSVIWNEWELVPVFDKLY